MARFPMTKMANILLYIPGINETEAEYLVTSQDLLPKLQKLLPKINTVKHIVYMENPIAKVSRVGNSHWTDEKNATSPCPISFIRERIREFSGRVRLQVKPEPLKGIKLMPYSQLEQLGETTGFDLKGIENFRSFLMFTAQICDGAVSRHTAFSHASPYFDVSVFEFFPLSKFTYTFSQVKRRRPMT